MNIYFLVEGRHTEKKIYPEWLKHLIPELKKVATSIDNRLSTIEVQLMQLEKQQNEILSLLGQTKQSIIHDASIDEDDEEQRHDVEPQVELHPALADDRFATLIRQAFFRTRHGRAQEAADQQNRKRNQNPRR